MTIGVVRPQNTKKQPNSVATHATLAASLATHTTRFDDVVDATLCGPTLAASLTTHATRFDDVVDATLCGPTHDACAVLDDGP
eukprot:1068950-Amphidinium_carterae.1